MRRVLAPLALVLAVAMAGCTDKLSFSSTASVDAPSFRVSPESGDADTEFAVDAGKLADAVNLTWDFGDGTIKYGRTATHKYGFTNGVMTIQLIATSADGRQGVAFRTVTLGSGENASPATSLRASAAWVEVGRTVNLSASGNDPDGDPLRYLWTYAVLEGGVAGDGHPHAHGAGTQASAQTFVLDSTSARAGVAFDAPGRYAVKVRVSDPKGGAAEAEKIIDVTSRIPDRLQEATFTGTLHVGTAGTGAAERGWGTPAPDTFLDAARHPFTLRYPGSTLALLRWNDTSGQGAFDLDLELRDAATGESIVRAETRAPAPAFELVVADLPPGDYEVVVRGYAGAQLAYTLLVSSTLHLTPELVRATEG